MKIGFLSSSLPYLPCSDGFRIYGSNLIRCLSSRHQIHLISLLWPQDRQYVNWASHFCASLCTIPCERASLPMRFVNLLSVLSCAKQLHCRKTFHASLWHAFRQQDWDVIHVEGPLMAGLLPRHFPIPRILSVHDSWRLRCDEI